MLHNLCIQLAELMLTSALGLDMSLLLLANYHSYPEGKENHMRVITKKPLQYLIPVATTTLWIFSMYW